MIHRALRARLGLLDPGSLPQSQQLAAQGVDLSRLERRADEADRYVGTFLKCVYLRDRVGQTFDGLITTVTRWRATAASGSASAASAAWRRASGCAWWLRR